MSDYIMFGMIVFFVFFTFYLLYERKKDVKLLEKYDHELLESKGLIFINQQLQSDEGLALYDLHNNQFEYNSSLKNIFPSDHRGQSLLGLEEKLSQAIKKYESSKQLKELNDIVYKDDYTDEIHFTGTRHEEKFGLYYKFVVKENKNKFWKNKDLSSYTLLKNLEEKVKLYSFVAFDMDGSFIFKNKRHVSNMQMFGIKLSDFENVWDVVEFSKLHTLSLESHELIKLLLKRSFSGSNIKNSYRIVMKNGMVKNYQIELLPIISDEQVQVGIVCIFIDKTSETLREQELNRLTEIEKKSNRAKSLFLANMSHEIRTPMNGILGLTNVLLKSEGLSSEQSKLLNFINRSGVSLLHIINDILDFSKIESGQIKIVKSPLLLRDLVSEIVPMFELEAKKKGIKFYVNLDPRLPDAVYMDGLRLKQVIINLINNAIKFTEEGLVRLEFQYMEDESTMKIVVKDSGIGIPIDEQKRIFEAFDQLEDVYKKRYAGTGLGLSISRQLVHAMGGELDVISSKGIGSVFYFQLPFEVCEDFDQVDDTVYENVPEVKVLIAEDHEINQILIHEMFKNSNVKIIVVNNGKELLEALEQVRVDLIFTDISMPIMDGITALRAIRKNPDYNSIPVIALTAHAMNEDREKLLKEGMDDFLPKPLAYESMMKCISKHLSNKQNFIPEYFTEKHHQDKAIEEIFDEGDVAELEMVEMLLKGNKALTYELAMTLISEYSPDRIEKMRTIIRNGEKASLNDMLHKLKGSCMNFRLVSLRDDLDTLSKMSTPYNIPQTDLILEDVMDEVRTFSSKVQFYKEFNKLA
ncbi:response regulator [Acidaminobacter sp. JC074]|uniref:response regulator n=1 Tax=Acidaminobacter sp. JC074 TaxID=2530199 RepID=UPI001F0FA826|nr:response regulator [Acidaminobacter sp. JC074]MCH4888188.1 response regulator [Acidaminobacter sp. JC074]